MYQLKVFLLFLLLFSNTHASDKITLHDFRFWTSPERTRIVIDVEEDIQYTVTSKGNRIDLNIHNAKFLRKTYDKLFYQDMRIKRTKLKRKLKEMHLLFTIRKSYHLKSYMLKPNSKYTHHRLVLDIYDKSKPIKKIIKKPIKRVIKKPTIPSTPPVIPNTPSVIPSATEGSRQTKKIILIDAGHGGEDPGAIGYYHSKEKKITLSIAKKLLKKLNKTRNFKALLTRHGDYYVGLTKRIRIAQANNASLFISIHADSVKRRSAKGASVYTLSERGGSTKFAKRLERSQNTADQFGGIEEVLKGDKYLKKILWNFSRRDRDIQSQKLGKHILQQMRKIGPLHKKTPQKAGFVVLKTPAIPSVLVETAFISNPQEEKRLVNKKEQDKIADALYHAILNYYK
ncbi:MAG: N-acetylmuramoyl-L-alanine amidase AmiC [Catillopecten margaritatus gill symbiont]|uniref:N-acetylmuramoyl-L-alanine amidase n=1 Tax=Catillopecten margaritatus gill symbiont TaxID=3083288 RepID=A0AAU6PGX7_9GAMM